MVSTFCKFWHFKKYYLIFNLKAENWFFDLKFQIFWTENFKTLHFTWILKTSIENSLKFLLIPLANYVALTKTVSWSDHVLLFLLFQLKYLIQMVVAAIKTNNKSSPLFLFFPKKFLSFSLAVTFIHAIKATKSLFQNFIVLLSCVLWFA